MRTKMRTQAAHVVYAINMNKNHTKPMKIKIQSSMIAIITSGALIGE